MFCHPISGPNLGATYYDYYTHPLETQVTEQQFSTSSSYSLSVSVSGEGTVSSDPSGIECGSFCTADFLDGTEVSLAASHDPSWTLGSWIWTGACAGSDACNIVMDEDKLANVHFYCQLITIPLRRQLIPQHPPGSVTTWKQ